MLHEEYLCLQDGTIVLVKEIDILNCNAPDGLSGLRDEVAY